MLLTRHRESKMHSVACQISWMLGTAGVLCYMLKSVAREAKNVKYKGRFRRYLEIALLQSAKPTDMKCSFKCVNIGNLGHR